MKTLVLLIVLTVPAAAKEKPRDYQDATLLSIKTVNGGTSCSGGGTINSTTSGNTDSNGDYSGTTNGTVSTSSGCAVRYIWLYTIKMGTSTYVIRPHFGPFGAWKHSALANQMPGTKVSVRSDNGKFYVLNGKKETQFDVVQAE